jgi:hypothetical protein
VEVSGVSRWRAIVIVDDAAQDFSSFNWVVSRRPFSWYRHLLPQTLMWPGRLIVADELIQHTLKMRFIEDQNVVETFFPGCAYPTLSVGIGIRRFEWGGDGVDTLGFKDVIEGLSEFAVIVAQQKAKITFVFFKCPDKLSCPLGNPVTIWVGCDAGQVNSARA